MKTWKKLVVTENDVESNILTSLNDPFLPIKAYLYHFQLVFVRVGPCSIGTAAKNLEEWNGT